MATIGYARVSTDEQSLDLQLDALKDAKCDRIFEDAGVSAIKRQRPGFEAAMSTLKPGDRFVTWKMDRAFRSVIHASAMLEEFVLSDIEFVCLTEPIDIGNAMGRCMYHVRSAFSELEREVIRERTIAGLEAARKRGVQLGRPPKLTTEQKRQIVKLWERGTISPKTLAAQFGVSQRTIARTIPRPQGSHTSRRHFQKNQVGER